MRKLIHGALITAAVVAGGGGLAHEGGKHVRGVVKEVSTERIVLTLADGKQLAIGLVAETTFTRAGEPVRATDVHPGARAVVHAKDVGGQLEATEVRLGGPARR